MSYHMRPEDNGMQGIMDYGDKPPIRIKLVLGPEPTRRANPSPAVTSEYDTRTSARGARTQQFTKSGVAVEPQLMEGVEMMDPHMYPNSTASKKNSRGTAQKDVRSQMHTGPVAGMPTPMTPGRPVTMGRGTMGNAMPGMVGTPGVPSTPVSGAYGRGNGMLPPAMVGSPAPYMQNPSSPYIHSGHLPMGIPGPANTPQMPRNVRSTPLETPMTPGPMPNGGSTFFDDSQPLNNNADELGSNLGSDDEDGDDKSKKNKRGKPKNRGNANRKKEEDDIFGDEDPQTAGYNASIAIWKTVEAYFADFTDEDFRLAAVDQKDDAFRVPNLGKKAQLSQHSLAHSASGSHLLQQSQSEMDIAPKLDTSSLFGGANGPSLITRLISSLIEESGMPSFPTYLAARPPVLDTPISSHEQDPMFGIVSQQEAEFIENRIQKELLALGLFGDFDAPADANGANGANGSSNFKDTRSSTGAAKEAAAEKDIDDDDEVLGELKRLQAKLRGRLESNNQVRALLKSQMDAANGERKKAKEAREALAKLDQSFVQQHKAIIKKRKKPTAKQAAAASSKAGTSKAEGSSSAQ